MSGHDLIVVGTSAGGLEALKTLACGLPAELPAAVCVVQHVAPESPALLAEIMSHSGVLEVVTATDGMKIEHGRIYVAPPDRHLIVAPGTLRVLRGPKENLYRPAVDVLFRSAATVYGPRVVGVVLTGNLDDGTAGLQAVKQCGGIAVVQDPQDALYPSMPKSALQHIAVDYTVPLSEMGALLTCLADQEAEDKSLYPVPTNLVREVQMAAMDELNLLEVDGEFGIPSTHICPECGGVLQERDEETVLRFRCHVGHAFSIQSLLQAQPKAVEEALWVALKVLQDRGRLIRRMYAQANERGSNGLVRHFEGRVQEIQQQIAVIEQLLKTATS